MTTSTVYLAARYSRRAEMQQIRDHLAAAHIEVTSRWIDLADAPNSFEWYVPELHGADDSGHAAPAYRSDIAMCDVVDVMRADAIMCFTPGGTRGGMHVEFGVAIGAGKRLMVVGPRINIFHNLPKVELYADAADAVEALRQERMARSSCEAMSLPWS